MHNIEPFFRWRDHYIAEEDERSPFFGRTYNEFEYSHQLYNFYLHPQWDEFGSSTLYGKILYVDYDEGYALLELIGEWNDTLHNDIMFLRQEIVDPLLRQGVSKFIFFGENILNFHGAEDDYYAEWAEEAREEDGWIAVINIRRHVEEEMHAVGLQHYLHFGETYNLLNWQPQKPAIIFHLVEALVSGQMRRITG